MSQFVWKKAVNKFYEKLKIKINDFRYSFNENNNTEFNDMYEIEKHLEKEISDKNIEFVQGKGVRKTQQIGVNSEYIMGLDLFPNPTDVRTLIPFLSVLESKNLKFKNIVADAGYESEENYEYLFNNNYTPYIEPQNYAKQKTRKI